MANTTQGGHSENRTIIIPPGSLNPDEVNVVYIPPSLHNTTHPLLVRPTSGRNRHFQAFSLPIWDDELSRRDEGNDTQNSVVSQGNRSIPGDSGYEADISAFGTTIAESSVHTTGYLADTSNADNVEYKKMCSNATAGGQRTPNVTQMSSKSLKVSSDGPTEGHAMNISAPGGMNPAAFQRVLQESVKDNSKVPSPDTSSSCPPTCGTSDQDDDLNLSGFQPDFHSTMQEPVPDSYYADMYDNPSGPYDSNQWPLTTVDESSFGPSNTFPFEYGRGKLPNKTYHGCPSPAKCAQPPPNATYVAPNNATFAQGIPSAPPTRGPQAPADRFSQSMNATYPLDAAGRGGGSQRMNASCPPGLAGASNAGRGPQQPVNATFAPAGRGSQPGNAPAAANATFAPNATYAGAPNATYAAPNEDDCFCAGDNLDYDEFDPMHISSFRSLTPQSFYDDMVDTDEEFNSDDLQTSSEMDDEAFAKVMGGEYNVISPMTPSPTKSGKAPCPQTCASWQNRGNKCYDAPADRRPRSMNATYPLDAAGGGGGGSQRMNASCPPGLAGAGNASAQRDAPYAPSALPNRGPPAPADRWSRSMNATYPFEAAGGGGSQRMNASYPPRPAGASSARRGPQQPVNATSAGCGSRPGRVPTISKFREHNPPTSFWASDLDMQWSPDPSFCTGDKLDYNEFEPANASSYKSVISPSFYDEMVGAAKSDKVPCPQACTSSLNKSKSNFGAQGKTPSPPPSAPSKRGPQAPADRSSMNNTWASSDDGELAEIMGSMYDKCPSVCSFSPSPTKPSTTQGSQRGAPQGNRPAQQMNAPHASSALPKSRPQAPADRSSMNNTWASSDDGELAEIMGSMYDKCPSVCSFSPSPKKPSTSQGSQCGSPQGNRSAQQMNAARATSPRNDSSAGADIECGCDNLNET